MPMSTKKAKPERFVLDCSVTVSWFFEDEVDAYAGSIEDSLASVVAVVPALWRLEVLNALLVGERRGRTTEAKATAFLTLLRSLAIEEDDETSLRAWHETLRVARTHGLSAYDAAYLELAMRRGLALATLDARMKTAASAVGIAMFKP